MQEEQISLKGSRFLESYFGCGLSVFISCNLVLRHPQMQAKIDSLQTNKRYI